MKFWYNPDHFGISSDSNISKYFKNVVSKHNFKYDNSIDNNNDKNYYYKDNDRKSKKQRKNDLDDGDNLTI